MKHSRRQEIQGDDDIWIEKIGNSRRTGNKRSYFKSKSTGQLVWDEPPSGASKIVLTEGNAWFGTGTRGVRGGGS